MNVELQKCSKHSGSQEQSSVCGRAFHARISLAAKCQLGPGDAMRHLLQIKYTLIRQLLLELSDQGMLYVPMYDPKIKHFAFCQDKNNAICIINDFNILTNR